MEVLTPEEWEQRCADAAPRLARIFQRKATVLALKMQSRAVANATTRPRSRNGYLRRSIAGRVLQGVRTLATVEGESSSVQQTGMAKVGIPMVATLSAGGRTGGENVVYARIQDAGGIVRPVRRKWLAIPDKSVKEPRGTPRYASPRDYPKPLQFKLIRGGSGRQALAVLLERVGGEDVARWWLKKEVEIPATEFAYNAWDETRSEVPSTLRDALELAFDSPGSIRRGSQ